MNFDNKSRITHLILIPNRLGILLQGIKEINQNGELDEVYNELLTAQNLEEGNQANPDENEGTLQPPLQALARDLKCAASSHPRSKSLHGTNLKKRGGRSAVISDYVEYYKQKVEVQGNGDAEADMKKRHQKWSTKALLEKAQHIKEADSHQVKERNEKLKNAV